MVSRLDNAIISDDQAPVFGTSAMPKKSLPFAMGYACTGILMGLMAGITSSFVSTNSGTYQGQLGISATQVTTILVCFFSGYLTSNMVAIKYRQQFGSLAFALTPVCIVILVSIPQFFHNSFQGMLILQFISGVGTGGLSTLAVFYTLQAAPNGLVRLPFLIICVSFVQLGGPINHILSPYVFFWGDYNYAVMFYCGLCMIVLAMVLIFPMSPARTTRVFDSIDWVSIPLVAMGFLCMSGFLMLGKTLWWTDTPLIGILIVGTIVIFFVVFLIERFRAQPLLDLRYLFRPTILRILLAAVLARFLMGEQSVAATGLLELNGIGNDEMVGFGFATLGGGLLGILFHLLTLKKLQWGSWQLLIAFGVISVCAFIDGATSNPLTRPWNMYPTQAAVTFAAVLFTAPALADGISRFILAGNRYYFITWVVFYILTQVGGSLAASAVFGSFQKIRTSVHYASLSDVITLSDPNVVARIAAYGGGLDGAKALSEEVNYQAGVSAYIDLFYLIGYLSLFTFVAFGMLKIFQLTTRDGLPFNQLLAKLVVK